MTDQVVEEETPRNVDPDETQRAQELDPVDEKVFSANLFWEGGDTYNIRLDELHALQERQMRGEEPSVGDASARDLVERIFKRAGLLDRRWADELIQVFAEALLSTARGDDGNVNTWLNSQYHHPARAGVVTQQPEPGSDTVREESHVSGYPKPTPQDDQSVEDILKDI